MVKMTAGGVSGIAISFLLYFTYQYYNSVNSNNESQSSISEYSDFKTDFISIPIFSGGKVNGYVSFKIFVKISDLDKSSNVLYYINDVLNRNINNISHIELSNKKYKENIMILIASAISNKFGSDLVGGVDVLDVAYDKRI